MSTGRSSCRRSSGCVQDVLLRRAGPFIAGPKLAVLLLGLLLSFSRGAIIDCVFSGALLLGLTFLHRDLGANAAARCRSR